MPNGTRDDIVGTPSTFVSAAGGPVDIVFGPDGALYYVAIFTGELRRVAPVTPPGSGVDPYLCYRARLDRGQARLPKGTQIELDDVLDTEPRTFDVKREVSICNPVSVDGGTVLEPTVHQEAYVVRRPPRTPRFVKQLHTATDAFGTRTLLLAAEDSLLVPASKVPGAGGAPPYAGTDVDHYKCHRARLAPGSPKFVAPAPPTLDDQFYPGGQSFSVKRVTKFCSPVTVDGSPVDQPDGRLVCYKVRLPAGVRFTRTTVSTNNPHFGEDVLVATAPNELCIPASAVP